MDDSLGLIYCPGVEMRQRYLQEKAVEWVQCFTVHVLENSNNFSVQVLLT